VETPTKPSGKTNRKRVMKYHIDQSEIWDIHTYIKKECHSTSRLWWNIKTLKCRDNLYSQIKRELDYLPQIIDDYTFSNIEVSQL
jgi:hypothetical protein